MAPGSLYIHREELTTAAAFVREVVRGRVYVYRLQLPVAVRTPDAQVFYYGSTIYLALRFVKCHAQNVV